MGTSSPAPSRRNTTNNNATEALEPNDFDDVFGGPPRSVLSRQFSVEGRTTASLFFEDIFRKPNSDRTLPEFRIPASKSGVRLSEEEFYSDIFGNGNSRRSRSVSQTNSTSISKSKSKSNSSSILSSEELSPFRPAVVENDDVSFSTFAAKLRPINVSSKWNTSKKMNDVDSPCNFESFESDYIHKFKGCYSGFTQLVSSPEITTFGPNSYASVKESNEDLQVNSPASIVSSLNQDQGDETSSINEEDEDDEVMSSYVIEINPSKNKEKIGESDGVDEAIAWAKQKCKSCNLEKEWNTREDECPAVEDTGRHESSEEPLQEPEKDESPCKQEELEKDEGLCKQMELELLDEDIKLWSDGKETNIRLLLATLHHILWPSSGWVMIQLKNLKDSSSVKKAYQKARLCLHPDKLQQRSATISQKYVAEKAFPILQDAWAAFISQDVCSSIK
ncbi:uncharacterized protein LOC143550675 [Bidens hawaiensis]|uniref:uncharacterized protein LOC143550675 n=1 Tax=Bidens hawaiensis TaxID=980011 RepID=UPI0040491E88